MSADTSIAKRRKLEEDVDDEFVEEDEDAVLLPASSQPSSEDHLQPDDESMRTPIKKRASHYFSIHEEHTEEPQQINSSFPCQVIPEALGRLTRTPPDGEDLLVFRNSNGRLRIYVADMKSRYSCYSTLTHKPCTVCNRIMKFGEMHLNFPADLNRRRIWADFLGFQYEDVLCSRLGPVSLSIRSGPICTEHFAEECFRNHNFNKAAIEAFGVPVAISPDVKWTHSEKTMLPNTFGFYNLLSHDAIRKTISKHFNTNGSHLLFVGAGALTTAVYEAATDLVKSSQVWNVVGNEEQILLALMKFYEHSDHGYRIIILDVTDRLIPKTQLFISSVMKNQDALFCIACNQLDDVTLGIRSLCVRYEVAPYYCPPEITMEDATVDSTEDDFKWFWDGEAGAAVGGGVESKRPPEPSTAKSSTPQREPTPEDPDAPSTSSKKVAPSSSTPAPTSTSRVTRSRKSAPASAAPKPAVPATRSSSRKAPEVSVSTASSKTSESESSKSSEQPKKSASSTAPPAPTSPEERPLKSKIAISLASGKPHSMAQNRLPMETAGEPSSRITTGAGTSKSISTGAIIQNRAGSSSPGGQAQQRQEEIPKDSEPSTSTEYSDQPRIHPIQPQHQNQNHMTHLEADQAQQRQEEEKIRAHMNIAEGPQKSGRKAAKRRINPDLRNWLFEECERGHSGTSCAQWVSREALYFYLHREDGAARWSIYKNKANSVTVEGFLKEVRKCFGNFLVALQPGKMYYFGFIRDPWVTNKLLNQNQNHMMSDGRRQGPPQPQHAHSENIISSSVSPTFKPSSEKRARIDPLSNNFVTSPSQNSTQSNGKSTAGIPSSMNFPPPGYSNGQSRGHNQNHVMSNGRRQGPPQPQHAHSENIISSSVSPTFNPRVFDVKPMLIPPVVPKSRSDSDMDKEDGEL